MARIALFEGFGARRGVRRRRFGSTAGRWSRFSRFGRTAGYGLGARGRTAGYGLGARGHRHSTLRGKPDTCQVVTVRGKRRELCYDSRGKIKSNRAATRGGRTAGLGVRRGIRRRRRF